MRDLSTLPRSVKSAIILATDSLLLPLALWMAFGFRLGPLDPSSPLGLADPFAWLAWADIAIIWLGSVAVLVAFRLYSIKLHTIDMDAVRRIALCSAAIGLLSAISAFFIQFQTPRSIPVLYGASFFLLAVCVRIFALHFLQRMAKIGSSTTPVAIYGAGAAGIQLAASLKQSSELTPVMFVDDNPSLHNVIMSGIRVKPLQTLKKAVEQQRVKQVLIAIPSLSSSRKEGLIREMRDLRCEVKVIPSYVDLVSGRDAIDNLRSVGPEELLGREKVDLDNPEITKAYTAQSIMVTGAGGSIGGELCRQLLECGPSQLVLFERSEPALYEIERQLRPEADEKGVTLSPILGSVTDKPAVEAALRRNGVDVVLHAAAHKHVPLIEANEVEGARNNVLGTCTVVDACLEAKVNRCILVSTDKAVRPTNVMGATKRLAELVVCDAQRRQTATQFSYVRFGNVLGSSGSVVPLFAKQIAAGGPVTVTHPDVTRYFMTIPEAARLVLLAGAYAAGNDMFVLDMGEPVKIMTLAQQMIELSGRAIIGPDNPDGDIAIAITGLRPGEKLYEELLVDDARLIPTPHPKILRAVSEGPEHVDIEHMLSAVRKAVDERDAPAVRSLAATYVEGFIDDHEASYKVVAFPSKATA